MICQTVLGKSHLKQRNFFSSNILLFCVGCIIYNVCLEKDKLVNSLPSDKLKPFADDKKLSY